jgi:hypothetical protein
MLRKLPNDEVLFGLKEGVEYRLKALTPMPLGKFIEYNFDGCYVWIEFELHSYYTWDNRSGCYSEAFDIEHPIWFIYEVEG